MFIEHNLQKALCDRIYEKRKPAALQLEQIVRKAIDANNTQFVDGIISELSRDFAYALRHPNYRNGGLIGLAAVAIALGQDLLPNYLDDIIQPILTCFGDADSRVRYYACESLYNVAKIAKGEILIYFNEIFDALCKLTADVEQSVRTGANLVDQLLRDIVVETTTKELFVIDKAPPVVPSGIEQPQGLEGPAFQSTENEAIEKAEPGSSNPEAVAAPPESPAVSEERPFTLTRFIPLLVERIYVLNPSTRMFLAQWIMLLDSIPELELVKYVPQFLEGLLLFLSDTHKEVRVFTKTCLDALLHTMKEISALRASTNPKESGIDAGLYRIGEDTYIDYPGIMETLVSKIDPANEQTRLVVLCWINGILEISSATVLEKLGGLLPLLIPSLSEEVTDIRDAAVGLNEKLLALISSRPRADLDKEIDSASTLRALGVLLEGGDKVGRLAALSWLSTLYKVKDLTGFREPVLTKLLMPPLNDPSDEVVGADLDVIGLFYENASADEFKTLGVTLLATFQASRELFANRGKLVLLQLCVRLGSERIFEVLAGLCGEALRKQSETEFYLLVIQNLNNILLTAPELGEFRAQLTRLNTIHGAKLFTVLFYNWVYNSVAALALCLLAGAYEPAFSVLESLARYDISVSSLVQIDRLIQYIEGPVFAPLRLHLLEPHRYPYLYKTLFGLLMVLPQSPAFKTLQARLHAISPIASLPITSQPQTGKSSDAEQKSEQPLVAWNKLLNAFRKAHEKGVDQQPFGVN